MATAPKKIAVKKTASNVASETNVLADVKGYARKIYLAGLGAYAKAGKEGADYLLDLVKAGEGVEKEGKKLVNQQVEAANSQIDNVKVSVKDRVDGVKGKVEVQFEKVEQAFDRRVASGLNRLGIPSKHDVDTLSAKLDVLTAMLERAAKAK
jgi:poly(hydroxyalkanoate) granule-associated protein